MLKLMPKLMTKIKFGATLAVIAVLAVPIQGCMQSGFSQKGFRKNDNCRFCHSTNEVKGVRDFSPIYDNPKSHHPVGVLYPLGALSRPDFNQPNGYSNGVLFFDDDGYGELDADDVRLFGTGNSVTVECASCHREHENASPSSTATTDAYLRFANEGSRLCITCHRK